MGMMSDETMETMVKSAFLSAERHVVFAFQGGEPLLAGLAFFRRFIELENVYKKRGVLIDHSIQTNGTLITLEMARRLKEAGAMGMGISLDSMDKEKHDQFRKFPGAWDGAVRGMRNCREVGLPFQIHTTVMDWNQNEIEKITDFAVSEGAAAHHFFFLVPTGRAVSIEEESLRAEAYEDALTRIMKKQQTVDIELKPTCAPQFMRIAKQMGMNLRFGRGCLAGTSYCIISPKGQVQPCAYLNIPLGDVRETPFDEIWKDNPVLNELRTLDYKGGCGVCEYKKACGGCRARAGRREGPMVLGRGGQVHQFGDRRARAGDRLRR
jgi:putative heme d1 biosynthesis radical SAM protein NirJ2